MKLWLTSIINGEEVVKEYDKDFSPTDENKLKRLLTLKHQLSVMNSSQLVAFQAHFNTGHGINIVSGERIESDPNWSLDDEIRKLQK